MDKILAPMTVEGTTVTTQTLRKVVDKMANVPAKFEAMDLISAIPQKGNDIHFQQEVMNRLMQRWRRMGLVEYKQKRWRLLPGAWDTLQKAWRDAPSE